MDNYTASQTESTIVTAVKEWLSTCDSRHASTCTNACYGSTHDEQLLIRPSRLIDVKNKCVVDGSVEGQYIALSYTWHNAKTSSHGNEELQLRTDNIDTLTSHNCLEKYSPLLPKVIRDAIELTNEIGVRYLWVDRLCITQDDPAKISEIERMDQIYVGAYMTIIAAASHGMFREEGETIHNPSAYTPKFGKRVFDDNISEDLVQSNVRWAYGDVSRSEWAKRAWTYQEYILSRRVVFFQGWRIFWQCECAVWDLGQLRPRPGNEAVIMGSLVRDIIRPPRASNSPDFDLYAGLVCPYNGRELSSPADGLFACLGILNHLAPAFPDGFVFGMPRLYLDHALLWQPLKGGYDKTVEDWHMDGCAERNSQSTRRPTLPSWAWCGWKCFIDPKSFQSALNIGQIGRGEGSVTNSWKLKSSTTWQHGSSKHGSALIHARGQHSSAMSPIQGPMPGRSTPSLDSNHISAWTTRISLFPAATLEIRKTPSFDACSIIKHAGHIRMFANPVLTETPLDEMPKVVVLQDGNRRWAGLIRITGDSKVKRGGKMEIVAISQGSANGRDLKSSFEERVFRRSRYHSARTFKTIYEDEHAVDTLGRHSDSYFKVVAVGEYEDNLILPGDYQDDVEYEFYNVLWVERGADGVAYRAGCGRVMKDFWEANSATQVEITLG